MQNTTKIQNKSIPTSQETKLFSYTGSKMKYKCHFDNIHTNINVKKVDTYIEAFAGTLASMFHNLSNISANRIIINDINPMLINLYRQIQINHKEVIETFRVLEQTFQDFVPEKLKGKGLIRENRDEIECLKNFYWEARDYFNKKELTSKTAGVMIFMLNHNFNGLYSEAKKTSNFNVSFNWNVRTIDISKVVENINNLHKFFTENNVIIENMDVDSLINQYSNQKDTMIYLDPPYTNSVIGYSSNQVTDYNTTQSHIKLLEKCKVFNYVIYSNNKNNVIEEQLDIVIPFNRTNGITQKQSNISKLEVLGYIDNSQVYMPSIEDLLTNNIKPISTIPVNNEKYMEVETLKCGTAFSGIGANEEALKNIDIKHSNEFMIEIDKFARKTFEENHNVKDIFTDITKVDPKQVSDIDLFVFGSPCQSYSQQGKRLGLEDTRGTLVYNGLQIVKEKQPKYFIYENVKGMVNHNNGHTFDVIKASFKELNYNIEYKVLNAKHYGAAQNRERLFIVGIRNDINQKFTFPKPQLVSKNVNDFISINNIDYKNYIFDSKNIEVYNSSRNTDIKRIYTIPNLKFESDRRIMSTNGISPCFLAGGCKSRFYDEKNMLFRYLTEQELTLIQGFNKDFKFPVSNSQVRKQIGNSIYVGLLEKILKNLIPKKYFNFIKTQEESLLAS